MTRILTPTLCALLITFGPSLWGCGGLSDDDDDSAGDGDSFEVEVTFDGSSAMVNLYDLAADADGAVAVSDAVDAAGVAAPDGYTYGFIASDGYAKDGYVWDDASLATLVQENGDLGWPEELGMEGADHVDGVVQIDLTAI
jgi:hypothetical protein